MFCSSCGKQAEDGMMFCSNCGNKLVVPEAVKEVAPEAPAAPVQPEPIQYEAPKAPAAPVQPEPVQYTAPAPAPTPAPAPKAPTAGGFGEIMKMFFKNPLGTIRYAGETGAMSTIFAILGIKAAVVGLIIAVTYAKAYSAVAYYDYYGMMGSSIGGILIGFIIGVIASMIGDAILIFLFFGMGKAFKGAGKLGQWCSAYATASIINICCLIMLMLLTAIGLPSVSMIFAAIIVMTGYALTFVAFMESMKLSEKNSVWAFVSVAGIYGVITALIYKIALSVITDMIMSSLWYY